MTTLALMNSNGTYTSYAIVIKDGDSVISMSSNDPWYRLFRAMADLFIDGQADVDIISDAVSQYAHRVGALTSCPAAHHVLRSMTLAVDEPGCLCDPYREHPCACEPTDRRERLRQLIGG